MSQIKLAMIQMRVEPGTKEANLDHAQELVAQAAAGGAALAVLPEAMTHGWTDPSARESADTIPAGRSPELTSAFHLSSPRL